MPPSTLGSFDPEEAAEGFGRVNGKASPQRSRSAAKPTKASKPRSNRAKRKPAGPTGMHQRRNKRMSW